MHLFESFLEMYKVLPSETLKSDIKDLLTLFKRLFYDDSLKLISEYSGWTPNGSENVYEPGHTFEWCCLIQDAEEHGLKFGILNAGEMAAAAEAQGMCDNKLVLQKVGKGQDDSRFRIWPSLERVR